MFRTFANIEHTNTKNSEHSNNEHWTILIEHWTSNIRELCNYRTLNIRTLNNEHRTSNDEHRTLIFEYWTMNIEHRTLNNNHRTLNNEHRTLNISFEHWTSNIEHLFFWKLANMANIECSMFDVRWPLLSVTILYFLMTPFRVKMTSEKSNLHSIKIL